MEGLPAGGISADVERLCEQAEALRRRLQRVLYALRLSAEMIADQLEGDEAPDRHLLAKKWRYQAERYADLHEQVTRLER